MIKRTLYFGNPAYLSQKNNQLVVKMPDVEEVKTIPIEDIGVIILDNQQITVTQSTMVLLLENNAAIITCDKRHHPLGLQLCLESNTLQSERYKAQIEASETLKKNLWQQTIQAKIYNQAMVLKELDVPIENMLHWSREVTSGDSKNHEARAAAYYWENLLQQHENFRRERFGEYPNNFFNYAYAILRAITARSLVASGLLPTLGIFHKNRYNAYCLADDVMEVYRPFVDMLVLKTIKQYPAEEELTKEIKAKLLSLPVIDVTIDKKRSPLQIAVQYTSASLAQCFNQERRKIKYPLYRGTI
ncbi:MAG: type II CRISPR-associated endonuclease Cas1 [Bacteroidales bacterium]|jgi:CRISPR-associated protein Cas1|nr:type II CRISPR-associated endonuclease Cas1 [Bacteroidales bacterium]